MSVQINAPYRPIWEPLEVGPIPNLGLIGIEDVLVRLIQRVVDPYRMDTEAANEIPDIPLDDEAREQTLDGKVKPGVFAGSIPFTVTGEIIPGVVKVPSVTVAASDATYGLQTGSGTVQILVATYGQGQNRQGRRDAMNLAERIIHEILVQLVVGELAALAGTENTATPISLRVVPTGEFSSADLNHFYCLITTTWDLTIPTPDIHRSTQTPWLFETAPAHPLP
jgi:hypothetical protein